MLAAMLSNSVSLGQLLNTNSSKENAGRADRDKMAPAVKAAGNTEQAFN